MGPLAALSTAARISQIETVAKPIREIGMRRKDGSEADCGKLCNAPRVVFFFEGDWIED